MYEPKPVFVERMKKLLTDEKDFESFMASIRKYPLNYIRCNTLKISYEKLKEILEKKGWQIKQPFKDYPEIMLVESELEPGELGKSLEHLLGYYYIQEVSSMMSVLALSPKPNEIILDLCAAPGSKTTYEAALMENAGTIIANDNSLDRIKILASNLGRCGVSNVIITREDGVNLCKKFQKLNFKFDKILLDVPCSGEGNIRSNPKTLLMWNEKMIKKLSNLQKKLAISAVSLLKDEGEVVYSTCTHAPEENEEIINFALKNFPVKIE